MNQRPICVRIIILHTCISCKECLELHYDISIVKQLSATKRPTTINGSQSGK